MPVRKPPRKKNTPDVETAVLAKSARRCALCFHLNGDLMEKHGQIAHLDEDRTNGAEDNLGFLCLAHHSLYDSRTSQHKNYTISEVKAFRSALYAAVADGRHLGSAPASMGRETDRTSLNDLIQLMNETGTMRFLRDACFSGSSFTWAEVEGLDRFLTDSKGAEHEFIASDLEALRKELMVTGEVLLSALVRNTDRTPQTPSYRAVPQEWRESQPERFSDTVSELRTKADKVCAVYDRLVRMGRTRLAP